MVSDDDADKPNSDQLELIWNIVVDLRKELVEEQKTRAKIMEMKITFLTALVSLISLLVASKFMETDVNGEFPGNFGECLLIVTLFSLPAFTSVFFDFLIDGCSIKIDKIGQYCRQNTEQLIRDELAGLHFRTWEKYLEDTKYQKIKKIKKKYKKILRRVPKIIKDDNIFYNPSYLGNKLLTLFSMSIAMVSIIWGTIVVFQIQNPQVSSSNYQWWGAIGISIVGGIIMFILVVIFITNVRLYSAYYKLCHNDVQNEIEKSKNK